MFDMRPITPLGGTDPRVETVGPVALTEVTDTALASFAARLGQQNAARRVLAAYAGAEPPAPGQARFGALDAFWMGPDQWMVAAPLDGHADLAETLKSKAGTAASITDQTDGWCRFDVTGDRLVSVFELLCPINIRDSASGAATRTTIHHLGCFVIVRAADHITVLGPRSSAGSLHHALLTAMRAAL